jgi:acyl-CoA reductase-like NAD-dependent aldehyde dehydrogenase
MTVRVRWWVRTVSWYAFPAPSMPESIGVVGVIARHASALLGPIAVAAPALLRGSTLVVADEQSPLPAATLAAAPATFDLSGGVVNVLTC